MMQQPAGIGAAARADGRTIMQSVAEAPDIGPAHNAPMGGVEPAQAIALDKLIDAHQATHGISRTVRPLRRP
jgi:hypothetical protein